MIEVAEVLYRVNKGIAKRHICRSLKISRNTVRRIIKQAESFGFCLGRSSNADIEEISREIMGTRNKTARKSNSIQERLSKNHEQIKEWLKERYMTTKQIKRLLTEQGEKASESSVRRYIYNNFQKPKKTTMHLETQPAKQAQVDFSYVGMMFDPILKKKRRTYAFIMTLSHSRYRFVRFTFKQDSASWNDCHIRAFNFFGGVPETVLLDNLKSGVIKPDIYDPTINRAYAELERHYGFVADPAKVRKAEHKGKVERSVLIVKEQIIAGRNHEDIQAANEYAEKWSRDDNAHTITSTTGKTPWVRFIRDEKDILIKLPEQDFERSTWKEATVHNDHHVVFEGSFYSVPTRYVSEKVMIRATARMVQIYYEEKLIKSHVRSAQKGKWITDTTDYPEHINKFLEQTPKACIGVAQSMGEHVYTVISRILTKPSITKQRKAQAVLRLADKYSIKRLNLACKRAIKHDNLKYNCIKKILELQLDKEEEPKKKIISCEGAFLREADEFGTEVEHG